MGTRQIFRKGTLVIQPLPGIGDMIWHLPIIHAIAAATPEGCVTVLTKPRSQADQLLKADPWVSKVLWLERNPGQHDGLVGLARLAQLLRQEHLRQVWVLHGSARYAFACILADIPERFGYGRGLQRYLLNQSVRLPPSKARGHPIELANCLLKLSNISPVETEPRLVLDPSVEKKVAARYCDFPRPWRVLGIGSSEPYKQWGEANFIQLAKRLGKQGGSIFVVGGPKEQEMGQSLGAQLRQQGIAAAEALALPLDETAALLASCEAYVGNDTGVLNMAAAVGTPAWGLFGASPPLRHSRHIHCILPAEGRGMAAITPAHVMAELQRSGVGNERFIFI
jgi:heptosyltransferase II